MQDLAKGERIYADQKCQLCHSVGDKGNKKGPLDNAGGKLKADEIRAWITDPKAMAEKTKGTRKPEMKPYSLAMDDLDALVGYVISLKKQAGRLTAFLVIVTGDWRGFRPRACE